ncbi:MAG: ATP-grasp domain-containing protein, partial [Rikenellaceae bacterium]
MKKLKIAVVAGGDSTEREISIKGGRYIIGELNKELYDTTLVYISRKGWYAEDEDGGKFDIDKNDFSYTKNSVKKTFDFALIVIHGTPGENGILQAYFELMEIPYSTSGVLSSAATFDKATTKALAAKAGAKVAREMIVLKGEEVDTKKIADTLSLPVFVKPNGAGSSFGVSKVKSEADLIPAIEKAFSEDHRVIIEEFLSGREVSCGIFKALGKEYVLPVTEIISETEYFDYEAKYLGKSREVTPAEISDDIRLKLNTECRKIYKALMCEALVRIDFIIKGDTPYMIEVNS